jgi:lycopene cyclase domain-containing protein
MTYLQFHLVFLLPALILAAIPAWRVRGRLGTRAGWALFAVPPIALAYTTPWDNYLVWKGVWYYGADRVVGTIGYVPVEEYLFFVLQPLLAGAVLYGLLGRLAAQAPRPARPSSPRGVRVVGAVPWLVAAAIGALLLGTEHGTYMGLILAWASPVVSLMWLFMGPAFWRLRRATFPAIALVTVYLWIADALAIRWGIWAISDRYTFGVEPLGLPIEEATFFFVTTVISVFGVMLFLVPGMRGPTEAS